jgi:hypothetical protein
MKSEQDCVDDAATALIRARALTRRDAEATQPKHIRRVALIVGIGANLLVIFALYEAMRPQQASEDKSIQVQMFAEAPAEPPLPEPAPAPAAVVQPARSVSRTVLPAPSPTTTVLAMPSPTKKSDMPSQLFNPDGSIRLAPAASLTPHEQGLERSRELMSRGHNVLHCRQSSYAESYKADESLGDEIARKYLSRVGLYSEYSAMKLANRQAAARADCDDLTAKPNAYSSSEASAQQEAKDK